MDEDDRNIFADAARLFFGARKSNDDAPAADNSRNITTDANTSTKAPETPPMSTQPANEDAEGSPTSNDSLEVDLWSKNVEDLMNLANVSDNVQFAPLDLSTSSNSATVAPTSWRSPKKETIFSDSDSESEDANLTQRIKTEATADQTCHYSDAQSVSRDGSVPASLAAVPVAAPFSREKIDYTEKDLTVSTDLKSANLESLLERDGGFTALPTDVEKVANGSSGGETLSKPQSVAPTRPADPTNVLTGDASVANVDLTVSTSDSVKSVGNCAPHTVDALLATDANKPGSPWPYPIEVPTSHSYLDAMMAVRKKESKKDEDLKGSQMPMNNNAATASKEKRRRSVSKTPQHQVRPLPPVSADIPGAPVQAQNNDHLRNACGSVPLATPPDFSSNLSGYGQLAQSVKLTPPPPPPLMLVPSPSASSVAKNLVPPPMRPHQNAGPSPLHRDAIQRQQANGSHQQTMRRLEMIQQNLKKHHLSAPQPFRPVPPCPPPYGYPQGPYPYSMQYLAYPGQYGQPPPGYYPHQMPPPPYPFMYNQAMGNQPLPLHGLGHPPHSQAPHPQPNAAPVPLNQVPYSTQHMFILNRQTHPPNQRMPPPQPFVHHPPNQHVVPHAASQPNHRVSPLPAPPTAPKLVPDGRLTSSHSQKAEAPRHHGPLDPIDSDFFFRFAARQAATVNQQQHQFQNTHQKPAPHVEHRNASQERPNPTVPQRHQQRRFLPPLSEDYGCRTFPTKADLRSASHSYSSLSAASRDNVKRVLSKHHKKPNQHKRPFEPRAPSADVPRNLFRSPSPTRSPSPEAGTSAELMKQISQRNPSGMTPELPAINSIDDDADFTIPSPPRMSLSPMPRKRRKISEKSERAMEAAFDKADRQSPLPQPEVRDAVSNCPVTAPSSTESTASKPPQKDPANLAEAEAEDDVIYIDSDDDGTIIIGSDTDDSDLEIEDCSQTEAEEEPFVYRDPKYNFINPELNKKCNGDLNGLEWIEERLKHMKKEGTFDQHFSGKDVKDAEWEIRSYITDNRQKQREVSTSRRLMNCVLQEVEEPWLKRYREECLECFNAKPDNVKPADVKNILKLEEGEVVD